MIMRKSLRILYLSHYYPPEVNAPAVRVSALSRCWGLLGHQVTVVTGFPNHPTGIVPREYRGKWFQKETEGNVTILRSFVYATPNKGIMLRVLNYLTFMFSAIISAVFRSGKQDMVIATSPQFFVAIAGFILSRIKRIPFVFEVRDIWPEEIVAVGIMKRGVIIKLLEKVELYLYRRASLIVAVASGTIEVLASRGVPRSKIVMIPNAVDVDRFANCRHDHSIRDRFSLNGHFLVSYIGTHGMAHNLRIVLKAAERLKYRKDVRFMFVGDGAEKADLVTMQERLGLDTVTFVPQQERMHIPHYYATADLCLVPLRRASLFTKNIPSKIYEIMASGKPMLIGAEGESRQLVEQAQAGIAYEPDNDCDLADKILQLCDDRDLAERLGANGRAFASLRCRQSVVAEKYIGILSRLV